MVIADVMDDEAESKMAPWSCTGRRRPTIYWGWVVTIASSIMFLVSYGSMMSFGIVMVELMQEFNSSATKTGYIGTTAYGLSSLSCLIAVPLNVYLGYRLGSMIGLASCIVSSIVTSFAPGLSLMFLSHGLLYGIGASMMVCGGINITISYFPGKHQSLATGISSAGANLGALIMNPVIYTLSAYLGWRNAFRIVSVLLFVIGFPAILTFAPAPTTSSSQSSNTSSSPLSKNSSSQSPTASSLPLEMADEADTEKPSTERTSDPRTNGNCAGCVEGGMLLREQNGDRYHVVCDEPRYLNRNVSRNADGRTKIVQSGNCSVADGITERSTMFEANGSVARHQRRDGNVPDSSVDNWHKEPTKVNAQRYESEGEAKNSYQERIIKSSEDASEGLKDAYWSTLFALLQMPDVWFLEIGLFTASIGLSFLMFSTANVIVTSGFSKKTASLVMAVMGFTEFIGKLVIGFVSDRLPIPKIFIIMAANCVGALLIIVLSFVDTKAYIFTQATVQGFFVLASLDSLPHSMGNQLYSSQYGIQLWSLNMLFMGIGGIFGAVFGESVDKTGSYNAAFYACVAIFLISTTFLGLSVIQQRVFARERFFVFSNAGKRYARIRRNDDEKERHLGLQKEADICREEGLRFSSDVVTEYLTSV